MDTSHTLWTREELDDWFVLIHHELRVLASSQRRKRGQHHDAGTTSLLHMAYERLARYEGLRVHDSKHFFAIAARVMRHILINQAEAMRAQKRGGGQPTASFEELEPWLRGRSLGEVELMHMIDLEAALADLAAEDEGLVQLVEHHIHLGMTLGEYAELQEISLSTVKRRWRLARAYLSRALENPAS